MPKKLLKKLIPTPKKVESGEGVLSLPCVIRAEHNEWKIYEKTFLSAAEKLFDLAPAGEDPRILLRRDGRLAAGSYVLDSTDNAVILSASDGEGIGYALATLLQIVKAEDGMLTVAAVRIEDAPDKDYRGLMVDLAREWHPAKTIFKYIDVCFMLKIKYLHLHFIDDQRYTLPSRAYPNLTAANRHYTFEDIEAFRAYANARGVLLIPEFEVPGHAAKMIAQYPEIFENQVSDGDDTSLVTEEGAVITAKNLICAGSETCMDAIWTLLAEICELFPESPYIHIGGDEANIRAWNFCPVCREYMRRHKIADVYELYSEFTGRVAQAVLDLGRTPIVWEGFPQAGVSYIPKETVVIAWETYYHPADKLLEAGFRVINASWQPLYVVPSHHRRWGTGELLDWNVYNWQHWWENSAAYEHPIQADPTEQVLGAQICAWECTFEQEIGKVLENLTTLSERTWNVDLSHDEVNFLSRVSAVVSRLARLIQDV